jgi:hypothetical protein
LTEEQHFKDEIIQAGKPEEEGAGDGHAPFVGSESVREWYDSHMSCQQPYRYGYPVTQPPKRAEKEIWPPAGRGVLQGWYTPRVSTPERLAREAARQSGLLLESLNRVHKTGAESAAEDRANAMEGLVTADRLWASVEAEIKMTGAKVARVIELLDSERSLSRAERISSASVAYAKALGYATMGDEIQTTTKKRMENAKLFLGLALSRMDETATPGQRGVPVKSAAKANATALSDSSPRGRPKTPKEHQESSQFDFALLLALYKFIENMSRGEPMAEDLRTTMKTAARQAPSKADKLAKEAGADLGILANVEAGYKLALHFNSRDRKIFLKLKKIEKVISATKVREARAAKVRRSQLRSIQAAKLRSR